MQRFLLYGKFLAYVLPAIMMAVFLFFLLVCSIPSTAYKPDYRVANTMRALLPEGWSFFTRSPREEMADVYKVDSNAVNKLTDCNAEPSNLFGISRKSRKVGMDISFLANIPHIKWENLSRESDNIAFKDTFDCKWDSRITTLKPGLYIISVYKPTPWAWRNTYPVLQKSYKVAMIRYDDRNSN